MHIRMYIAKTHFLIHVAILLAKWTNGLYRLAGLTTYIQLTINQLNYNPLPCMDYT